MTSTRSFTGNRWATLGRLIDRAGHFVVGAVPGFLGGLTSGRIAVALLIGCATGLAWLLLRMRFGERLDSGLELSPDQVAARARARSNGYMGPGLG